MAYLAYILGWVRKLIFDLIGLILPIFSTERVARMAYVVWMTCHVLLVAVRFDSELFRIPVVYIGVVLIGAIGLLLNFTLNWVEGRIVHWKGR